MENDGFRRESDLLGELRVPEKAYYGVQTQRALDNYRISGRRLSDCPDFVESMAYVKWAAALANAELGVLDAGIAEAIAAACREITEGALLAEFPVDLVQGGAGTSVNMNANEVIANRALELMGRRKGEYRYCSPNDHVNCGQSTNDAYPTAIRCTFIRLNAKLVACLRRLSRAFAEKGEEFAGVLKMGRTQLQDAVPMTAGQELTAFAHNLEAEIAQLEYSASLLHEINMGGTAIGTGLNAAPGFAGRCAEKLSGLLGEEFRPAADLVAATPDTGDYVAYSSALKRLAVKLSKICNDLRLLASGPCCGLHEISLPAMAPGSSIMPGKVNPVIPEVTNQVCFKVIGNDVTVCLAAEAGQLQLNVMEPIIAEAIIESVTWLIRAMDTLREKCVEGLSFHAEVCGNMVRHSIGIVTALNPHIGYKASTAVAKEALASGRPVYDIVLERGLLTRQQLDEALDPARMAAPHELQ